MVKYRINMVKMIREEERKARTQRLSILLISLSCFAFLLISIFYSTLQVLGMQLLINKEREKLARIETEYKKYRKTKMTVNKSDIELLDRLQTNRIYWTKKLESMAMHLPDSQPISYWITDFGYKQNSFTVRGYGYITPMQEQLIELDTYLNNLRMDQNFSDIFRTIYLNSAVRTDEAVRRRVSFEYSSLRREGGK
ncbi:MAG: PilN domain-containing protein [Chitinispirillaceae bacterium]